MKTNFELIVHAGIHLGSPVSRRNPKMFKFSYGVYGEVHIIDLAKSYKGLIQAQEFIATQVKIGSNILFVGTKEQAARAIENAAKASNIFYVNKRWLGGTLTNWRTIRGSLLRLSHIEREKREGAWTHLQKKESSFLHKRLNRLERNLKGLKGMQSVPEIVIVVDPAVELNAVRECQSRNIPVVCRSNIDCNPTLIKTGVLVPMNTASTARILLFLETLVLTIKEASA
jgi:small subunit ribosomal protein S2